MIAHHGPSEASRAALCAGVEVEDSGSTGQLHSTNMHKCIIMKHRKTQVETKQTLIVTDKD